MNETAGASTDTNVVGRRIVAAIIDAIVVGVIFFVMTLVFGDSESSSGDDGASFNFSLSGLPFIVTLLITWAYYAVMEAMNKGQTVGKLVMGVRTVSADGGALTFSKAAIRNLLRLVDNFPYILPLLGLILIAVTGKHQRVGDMAAGTLVVRA